MEAFLLENTIMEIRARAELKDADHAFLKEMLNTEWSVYDDLAFRIDSSLDNVLHHTEIYHSLKPAIDTLLSQADRQP